MSKYVDGNGSEKRVVSVVRTENVYTGEIDEKFDDSSTNPIENRVITKHLINDDFIKANNISSSDSYEARKENILDSVSWTDGGYLYNNDVVDNNTTSYSDFIWIEKGTKLLGFSPYNLAGQYYNENKEYLGNLYLPSSGGGEEGSFITTSPTQEFLGGYFVRLNYPTANKGKAKTIAYKKYNGYKKELKWLLIDPSQIKNGELNFKQTISDSYGEPRIPFIRNHMWLKNGSLYEGNEIYGSTETIPLQDAQSIIVFPLYKYGLEENVGNGSFVDKNGNFIANIDDGAVWDENHLTFTTDVPINAYGIQLNVVLTSVAQGEYYYTGSSDTNNPSSLIYVQLNAIKKSFDWLKLGDDVITPNNFNTNPIYEKHTISQNDGTPIVEFIRNHMWLKNGNLYSANSNWGSTKTISLNGITHFRLLPYYKYNKENNVDNGAFVDQDGNWVASLMANATWDDSHTYLEVEVPNGAYGFQINATFTSSDKYEGGVGTSNTNPSSQLYYSTEYTINVSWLRGSGAIDWSNIPNNVITYDSLSGDVRDRLVLPYDESYKYWDTLNKPFDFQGKNLVAFGDSITSGVANEGSGNISAGSNSFINLFSTKFNMTFNNEAVSGSCITSGVNELTPICTKIDNYTFLNTADEFIFVIGGTNDFNSDAPLGQLGDTETTSFYGALDHICQRLKSVAPNSIVIFITPINVNTTNFPRKSDPSLTLNKYRNAIWEVATKYEYNVVDGSTIGFAKEVNTSWGNLMIHPNDGTHPTLAGHKLYFRGLCGKLL